MNNKNRKYQQNDNEKMEMLQNENKERTGKDKINRISYIHDKKKRKYRLQK